MDNDLKHTEKATEELFKANKLNIFNGQVIAAETLPQTAQTVLCSNQPSVSKRLNASQNCVLNKDTKNKKCYYRGPSIIIGNPDILA